MVGGYVTEVVECPDCHGVVQTEPCRRCWGAGTVLLISVPKEEPDV